MAREIVKIHRRLLESCANIQWPIHGFIRDIILLPII